MGRIRFVKEYVPEVREIRYRSEDFARAYTLICDNGSMADPHYQVVVLPEASEAIFNHIGWGTRTPQNRNEQGGFLAGRHYYDSEKELHVCVVELALPAPKAKSSPVAIEISHKDSEEMYRVLDEVNLTRPEGEKLVTVGWYHTHPNELDVFMSGIDQGTQRQLFSGEKAIALVFNPNRRIWSCFRSDACLDEKAEMLIDHSALRKFGKSRLTNQRLKFGG